MSVYKRVFYVVSICIFTVFCPLATASSETQFSAKWVHYNRNFAKQKNSLTQTGLGLILRHQRNFFDNKLRFQLGAYSAIHFASDGRRKEDVFQLRDDVVQGFSKIGEAKVVFAPTQNFSVGLGRFKHASMFLKSKTRALPSTFQGIQLLYSPNKNQEFYFYRFNKWSRRANKRFSPFSVNSDTGKKYNIDAISIVSAKLTIPKQNLYIHTEYLHANDFIRKWGLSIKYKHVLNTKNTLTSKAGYFISNDAGALFTQSTVPVLDKNPLLNDSLRLHHRGKGFYWQNIYQYKNHTLHLGFSQFGQPWIEDNFSGDHGLTPFPSKTIGPDLSNKNEQVWFGGYQYQWRENALSGLSISLDAAFGHNIENSVDKDLGSATENWLAAQLHYSPPWFKNISLRIRYRKYQSNIMGDVAGVRSNREETRIALQYKTQI